MCLFRRHTDFDLAEFAVPNSMVGVKTDRVCVAAIFEGRVNRSRNIVGAVKGSASRPVGKQSEGIAPVLAREKADESAGLDPVGITGEDRDVYAIEDPGSGAHVAGARRAWSVRVIETEVVSI